MTHADSNPELARVRAFLVAHDSARAASYERFVPAEMGLFEGTLALSPEYGLFVRNRFGTLEAEPPFRFADAAEGSVRTTEGLFGGEVAWTSSGSPLRIARLAKADADELCRRLRAGHAIEGAGRAAASAPPVAAEGPRASFVAPVRPAVLVATVASVGPTPSASPPRRPRPASVGPAARAGRGAAFLAITLHALGAGLVVHFVWSTAVRHGATPFVERLVYWMSFALALPLVELAITAIARRSTGGRSIAAPRQAEPRAPVALRWCWFTVAGAFATFASAFFLVFVESRVGPSSLYARLTTAALGIAITWPKGHLPWFSSALALVLGGAVGNQLTGIVYALPLGTLLLENVDLGVFAAWFAHMTWLELRTDTPAKA